MVDRLRGLFAPFRRDRARDFASATGAELLVSKVLQVLGTESDGVGAAGELPFRTSFGSRLSQLLHQPNDVILSELARVHVRDALRRWLPEAEVASVSVERDGSTLRFRVRIRDAQVAERELVVEVTA